MYQIKIKIITTKGEKDDKPTVNLIHPDQKMAKFAELRNVDLGEMVIFHEDDSHFNLVVAGDSDLATLGSLSYRFNIGPMDTVEHHETEDDDIVDVKEETDDVEDLRKQLKKCKESKAVLETAYTKCEKELRQKTEESIKLKVEINDLKQMIKLGQQLDQMDVSEEIQEEEIHLSKMKSSGFRRRSPQVEASPTKSSP